MPTMQKLLSKEGLLASIFGIRKFPRRYEETNNSSQALIRLVRTASKQSYAHSSVQCYFELTPVVSLTKDKKKTRSLPTISFSIQGGNNLKS